jgi:hypothetical protein
MNENGSKKRKIGHDGARWTGLLVGVALISKHLSTRMEVTQEMGRIAP